MPIGGGGCLPVRLKPALSVLPLGPETLASTVIGEACLLPSYVSVMSLVGLDIVSDSPAPRHRAD